MTGIQPRQQVQQLCNQLADLKRIRRYSVGKTGKRRKIHNFPTKEADAVLNPSVTGSKPQDWRRRLAALVAATDRTEEDLLEESVRLLAMKVLRQNNGEPGESGEK
jgi:hypothetical protein